MGGTTGGGSDDSNDSSDSSGSPDEAYVAQVRADEEEEDSDDPDAGERLTWVDRPPPGAGPPAGNDDAAEGATGPPGEARVAIEVDAPHDGPPDGNAAVPEQRPLIKLLKPLYAERASRQAEGMKLIIRMTNTASTRRGSPARNEGSLVSPMRRSRPTT